MKVCFRTSLNIRKHSSVQCHLVKKFLDGNKICRPSPLQKQYQQCFYSRYLLWSCLLRRVFLHSGDNLLDKHRGPAHNELHVCSSHLGINLKEMETKKCLFYIFFTAIIWSYSIPNTKYNNSISKNTMLFVIINLHLLS